MRGGGIPIPIFLCRKCRVWFWFCRMLLSLEIFIDGPPDKSAYSPTSVGLFREVFILLRIQPDGYFSQFKSSPFTILNRYNSRQNRKFTSWKPLGVIESPSTKKIRTARYTCVLTWDPPTSSTQHGQTRPLNMTLGCLVCFTWVGRNNGGFCTVKIES